MKYFEDYFKYIGKTESPMHFHRWASISMLSAWMGRNVWLPFGHSNLYLNQYILLMGSPGSRKSGAIAPSRKILSLAGYTRFASEKTSKERFIIDMRNTIDDEDISIEDLEDLVLDAPSETYISNGEFLDFIGRGDMDFLTLLTNLWDCPEEPYKHPKITGKSIVVEKPTINILGGATVKGLGLAIPPEALGTGILSRLILIHGERTSTRITFPEAVNTDARKAMVDNLLRIRAECVGEISRSKDASHVLDRMYKEYVELEDPRFADYASRRFTHLYKLCGILAISRCSMEISVEDALAANSILNNAEQRMPKALGEFGLSRHSDTANRVMEILKNSKYPLDHNHLWKRMAMDFNDINELKALLRNLITSDRIQVVGGTQPGYLPRESVEHCWDPSLLLDDFLLEEELI